MAKIRMCIAEIKKIRPHKDKDDKHDFGTCININYGGMNISFFFMNNLFILFSTKYKTKFGRNLDLKKNVLTLNPASCLAYLIYLCICV